MNSQDLMAKHCWEPDVSPSLLMLKEIKQYRQFLNSDWTLVAGTKLRQSFEFMDFMEAMVFINDVAALAENEGHHPDVAVRDRRVVLEITTHGANGLTEKDFILAKKIELCC